jgi:hypothetical protein
VREEMRMQKERKTGINNKKKDGDDDDDEDGF